MSVREEPGVFDLHEQRDGWLLLLRASTLPERREVPVSARRGPNRAFLLLPVLLTPTAQQRQAEHNQVSSCRALASGRLIPPQLALGVPGLSLSFIWSIRDSTAGGAMG